MHANISFRNEYIFEQKSNQKLRDSNGTILMHFQLLFFWVPHILCENIKNERLSLTRSCRIHTKYFENLPVRMEFGRRQDCQVCQIPVH